MANQRTQNLPGPAGNVDPAGKLTLVVASDTADIFTDGRPCRALLVGTGGAADLIDASGTARSAVPLQTGFNPIRVTRIKATNLVAANIWALE